MSDSPTVAPADLIGRPLFWPLAHLLGAYPHALPDAPSLNAALRRHVPGLLVGAGHDLSFVAPEACAEPDAGYEARIHRHGQVLTRSDNWHDFFNALVWLAFPLAKAALSRRHMASLAEQAQAGSRERGRLRDALTQFDECGIAVLASDGSLLEALRQHRWQEVFWLRRAELAEKMRFVVFGHGSYDQLRAPFFGLCAKAVYLEVAPDWLARPWPQQAADLDGRLADWLSRDVGQPADLKPLPLLGIPSVTPDNQTADYYADTRQFRPLRRQVVNS